jgi:hypothetical protein
MSHTPLTATIDGDAPPRDRIFLEHRDGRPAIFLPRAMFRGRMWMIIAFGLPFLVLPAFMNVGSGRILIQLVFQTIGMAIVGVGIFLVLLRQVIVDDGEQLVVEIDLFGRPVHYSDVLKRDVERVAIRTVRDRSKTAQASLRSTESDSKYYAVYLEASDDRCFCLAPCLSIEELDWLRRTIEFWVRRGSDL